LNFATANSVLEQNPPKQGLKQVSTSIIACNSPVLEQNPPKQGLKRNFDVHLFLFDFGFRAKSTKTRIETPSKIVSILVG